MRQVTEIEYAYTRHDYTPFKYQGTVMKVFGPRATLYKWMLCCVGKEEAAQEFTELFLENKNGAHSPVAPLS